MVTKTKNAPVPPIEEWMSEGDDEKRLRDAPGVSIPTPIELHERDLFPVPDETAKPTVPDVASGHTSPAPLSEPPASTAQIVPTGDTIDSPDDRTTTDTDPSRRTVKRRKSDLDEYRRRFMQTPKIIDRKPVFVSREVRDRLDRFVRLFGERGMSVSGLVENIVLHHLSVYKADIEQWRKM